SGTSSQFPSEDGILLEKESRDALGSPQPTRRLAVACGRKIEERQAFEHLGIVHRSVKRGHQTFSNFELAHRDRGVSSEGAVAIRASTRVLERGQQSRHPHQRQWKPG